MSSKARKITEIIIITLLSAAAGYGVSVNFCGSVGGLYTENYIKPFGILNILVFALTFAVLYFLLEIINKYRDRIGGWITTSPVSKEGKLTSRESAKKSSEESCKESDGLSKNKFFWIVFAGIVLFWLPYLLSFYPGSVLGDSLDSIYEIIYGYYDNRMPIIYTLYIEIFLWIGYLCGNINTGIFVYACVQYLLLALTCASILTWLYTHKVKTVIVIIAALFYAIFPVFPAYAIIMWKDPIFSMALAALSFILLNEKSTWYQVLISTLVILFFRSNGIVIIAVIAVVMLCVKEKRIKGVICVAALVFSIIVSNALLNHFQARRLREEAIGIPIQQMAYTTIYEYDSLSDTEKANIDYIIPIDVIRESYTPCLVDSLKWHEQFNLECVRNHTGDVLGVWLGMLPKHLGSYIEAYALETYGFWMPLVQSDYGYIDIYVSENGYGIEQKDVFKEILGVSIQEALLNFKPYIGSGTLIWITLLGCALCVLSNQIKKLWFYLPGVLCWLSVMISTPVAFSLRYVFILILLIPAYILLPFTDTQK